MPLYFSNEKNISPFSSCPGCKVSELQSARYCCVRRNALKVQTPNSASSLMPGLSADSWSEPLMHALPWKDRQSSKGRTHMYFGTAVMTKLRVLWNFSVWNYPLRTSVPPYCKYLVRNLSMYSVQYSVPYKISHWPCSSR